MAYQPKDRPHGLSGTRGLLTAVVHTAQKDAVEGSGDHRADTWAYFASDLYAHHREVLGLAEDAIPETFQEKAAGYEGQPDMKGDLRYWLLANTDEAKEWRATAPTEELAAHLIEFSERRKNMSDSFFVAATPTGYIVTNEDGVQVNTAVDLARLSKSDLFRLALVTLNAMGSSFEALGIAAPADGDGDEDTQRVDWDAVKQALSENFDADDFAPADDAGDEPDANVARGDGVLLEAPMPTGNAVDEHHRQQAEFNTAMPEGIVVTDEDLERMRQPQINEGDGVLIEAPMPQAKGDDS